MMKIRKLHMKMNDEECDEHVHDKSNVRQKVCVYKYKKEKLSKNVYGIIGTFTNRVLRIIDVDKEFISSDPIQVKGKKLNDDVIQAIKNNEAIAVADTSVKDEVMAGVWTIEDDCRINRCKNELVSNQWKQNTGLVAEAMTMTDLVIIVVKNTGVNEHGKLKVCADYKIVSDILLLDIIKASQFALDGGAIISKIMQI